MSALREETSLEAINGNGRVLPNWRWIVFYYKILLFVAYRLIFCVFSSIIYIKLKIMKKDPRALDKLQPYRLAHQTLCITGFNFETESLVGYVEMLLHPLRPDLKRLKINVKQCKIYRVSVNDLWEAIFSYHDPTLEITQGDAKQRNLDYFESCHVTAMTNVDASNGNGELVVNIPQEVAPTIADMKPFRVTIEFSLETPKGGVKFVVPDIDGTMLDRGAHLFTYGHENASRLWFPCIDLYSEVCTWKLEFTVDMYMTAVSCGDLIETVYTPDLRKKTYHYYLPTPTSAPNIALAVGPFEILVDPHMHEVTHFCLPHLLPILKQSTEFLHEAFEFYEELLSIRYPYSCYKQVFVDQAYADAMPYATMTIFSTNLLHSKKSIDQPPVSRQLMAHAIAQQFFGSFIAMNSWCDAWLPRGIAGYLSILYRRRAFGNNEYRYFIAEEMKTVQEYEQNMGGVILDPANAKDNMMYFPAKHPQTVSSQYFEICHKKSHLILRMLEIRIGKELLLQVINKLLALATTACKQKFSAHTWHNMLLSTDSFLKCISSVTGKDVRNFMEQWVHQGGHARFYGNFVFNRKRNVVELELKQDFLAKGALKYVGPLTVSIQELDGTFNHTFNIEENRTKFEITCHSKSRRHKKKKIPLCTGEEVDMDLTDSDADSPVLWLRVDPELTIMRQVCLEQPDWMWQFLLRYERCVVSQNQAIAALEQYPTPKSRLALTDTLENDKCFYRVRMVAAHCLAKIANSMVSSWAGPPAMMTIFRKMFGSHSCPSIVRLNNFCNFQHYHLQKTIPVAMAQLRTVYMTCPPDVLHFLLDLLKYNDNNRNKYSDGSYRAALIDALADTVTPAVTTVAVTGFGPSTDALTGDTKLILEEITRCLNLEKLLPSYKHEVTVSCLKAIRKLQKFGHLPSEAAIFKSYAMPGNFVDVRLAGLEALVDYTKVESSPEVLDWLLDIVVEDPELYVKHKTVQMLVSQPPFSRKDESPINTPDLVERLWTLMNSGFSHDSRLRCDVTDLYHALYGRTRPLCLPIPESVMVLNLKEKTTLMNPSFIPDIEMQEEVVVDEPSVISVGTKRKAESPLTPIMSSDNRMHTEFIDSDSQLKCKIRVSSMSPEETASRGLEGQMFTPVQSPYPTQLQNYSYPEEYRGSPEVGQQVRTTEDSIKLEAERRVDSMPPAMKYEESGSRLSEDSADSNSLPPMLLKSGDSASMQPTSFKQEMFPPSDRTFSPGLENPSERSPSLDNTGPTFNPIHMEHIVSAQEQVLTTSHLNQLSHTTPLFQFTPSASLDQTIATSPPDQFTPSSITPLAQTIPSVLQPDQFITTTPQPDDPSLRHHKSKKKKKKNKHKHKHRSKHEKYSKPSKDSSNRYGDALDVVATSTELPSSGPSHLNSPHSSPGSPEFEVI